MNNSITITIAKTENHFSEAKVLFLEYAKELDVDLCFQDFDQELQEMDIQYNAPGGILLLLENASGFAGCVGFRKVSEEIAEMKRMYIQKEFRGKGWGKRLIEELLEHAKKLNYTSIRLDTLPQMKEAIRLYTAFGFKEIPPYRHNPIEGTKYMEYIFPQP